MRPTLFYIGAVTCDVLTTYTIVGALGGEELNPLIALIIAKGWLTFLLVKYGLGVVLPLVHDLWMKSRRMLLISAWLHFAIALINSVSLIAHHLG